MATLTRDDNIEVKYDARTDIYLLRKRLDT